MKKIIIIAFLVVSLFAVSVVSAFADGEGVAFFARYTSITSSWFNDSHHVPYETLLDMVNDLSHSEGNAVCGTTLTSTNNVIIYDVDIIQYGDKLCVEVRDKSQVRYVYGGYVGSLFFAYWCYSYEGADLWDIFSHIDGIEGYIDQIEGRLARTVGSSVYTVADSCYLLLDELRGMIPYIDQIEGRLARTVNGTTFTVADSSYLAWQQLSSMSDTLDRAAGRLLKTASDGTKYTVAELSYNIWSRMNDLISAVNNQHITLDTSNIRVNVDGSNFNAWNTKAYCCGYREDSTGAAYETLTIPYDTALDILARINTEYIGQSVTVLNRDGSSYLRYVRSASLLGDGAIRVSLTNGFSYYLCDNSNVIYIADLSGSPDHLITSAVDTLGAKLDTINESVMAIDLNVEVIQDVQQYDDDVDNGVDALSKILDLVREFFNPDAETNWRGAKDYAMHWGSDVE